MLEIANVHFHEGARLCQNLKYICIYIDGCSHFEIELGFSAVEV